MKRAVSVLLMLALNCFSDRVHEPRQYAAQTRGQIL